MRIVCKIVGAFLLFVNSYAQLSITALDTPFLIDFESTVAGVSSGTFDGSGLTPTPSSGQLDSDAWEILGLSDGDLTFGSIGTSGDYARGASSGSVTTGGIYAFDVGSGDVAFGVQPGGLDFTPGKIVLRIVNNSGNDIKTIELTYKVNHFNNGGYSNSLNIAYSNDNSMFVGLSELDFATTEVADGSPSWGEETKSVVISAHLSDGESLYLQWNSNDVSGSGSRDEIAIDDIVITARSSNEGILVTEIVDHGEDYNESYLEIYNSGSLPINIEGWQLMERYNPNNADERTATANSSTQMNSGSSGYFTLAFNEYAVFVRGDAAGLKTRHSIANDIALFENSVPQLNDDERHQLVNAVGDIIDNFGLWNYADGSSFRFDNANAYQRTGGSTSDGELESSWTKSAIASYTYTPGSANFIPLPVGLTSFSAIQTDAGVELNWETATEVNNYGFNVERKQDEGQWLNIGFVQGHGNSNSLKLYKFVDIEALPGNLRYRLKQIDTDGVFAYYALTAEINNSITSVEGNEISIEYSLEQNYPNPFNPSTTIAYSISVVDVPSGVEGHKVSLKIYDILGNEVSQLVNKYQPAGFYRVEFDGSNLSSGMYFYKIKAGEFVGIKKMTLIK